MEKRYDPDKEVADRKPDPWPPPVTQKGQDSRLFKYSEDTISGCKSAMLSYISAKSTLLKAVLTDIYFCLEDNCVSSKALLDSGATDGSYIDESFFNSIKDRVPGIILPYDNEVILGDKKTKIHLNKIRCYNNF